MAIRSAIQATMMAISVRRAPMRSTSRPIAVAAEDRGDRQHEKQRDLAASLEAHRLHGVDRHERDDGADRVLIEKRGEDEGERAGIPLGVTQRVADVGERRTPRDGLTFLRGW